MLNTPINKYIPIWYYLSHNITQSDRSSHCHHHCAPAAAVSTSAWPEEILTNQRPVFRSILTKQRPVFTSSTSLAILTLYPVPGSVPVTSAVSLRIHEIRDGIGISELTHIQLILLSQYSVQRSPYYPWTWWCDDHCYLGVVSGLAPANPSPDTEAESEERREAPGAPITLLLQWQGLEHRHCLSICQQMCQTWGKIHKNIIKGLYKNALVEWCLGLKNVH